MLIAACALINCATAGPRPALSPSHATAAEPLGESGSVSSAARDSLSSSDVMQVIWASRGALGRCVEEQRRKDPGLSGKLLMTWEIKVSGTVTNVSVISEELKSTYIAACIGGVIQGLVFPPVKTAPHPVVFPFKF